MNALEKLSLLGAAAGPVTKDIEVTVGDQTQLLKIRRMSFIEAQQISTIPFAIDNDGNASFAKDQMPKRNAAIIAACLVNDDGSTVLNSDQASALVPEIGSQLLKAINEFNALVAKPLEAAAKNSLATDTVATS